MCWIRAAVVFYCWKYLWWQLRSFEWRLLRTRGPRCCQSLDLSGWFQSRRARQRTWRCSSRSPWALVRCRRRAASWPRAGPRTAPSGSGPATHTQYVHTVRAPTLHCSPTFSSILTRYLPLSSPAASCVEYQRPTELLPKNHFNYVRGYNNYINTAHSFTLSYLSHD